MQFVAGLGMLLREVVLFPIEVKAERILPPQRLVLELQLTTHQIPKVIEGGFHAG